MRDGAQPVGIELKAKILSFNPMKISDDDQYFLEIEQLMDDIDPAYYQRQNKNFELTIKDWKFVFRRVPTSHEYYFDISAKDFTVEPTNAVPRFDIRWTGLNDDADIK